MSNSPAVNWLSMSALGAALAISGILAPAAKTQAATPYSYTETFEDGALNSPGVTASGGFVLGPGGLTDSVQGANPGSGSNGFSYYSGGNTFLTFTFSKAVLGSLPTVAGLTWTDVGFIDGDSPPQFTGVAEFIFSAYDESNNLLGQIVRTLGDGRVTGETAEDFIFSFQSASGIGSIQIGSNISGDWEIDDLQYSAPVPTPALLPGLVGFGLGFWRKRKQAKEVLES